MPRRKSRVILNQPSLDGTPHNPDWSTVAEMLSDKTGKRWWLYGGGTNSTAGIIESIKRKIRIDGVLFADTGSERPNTIEFIPIFQEYLAKHGLEIKAVSKGESLYDYCINNDRVPDVRHRWCTKDFKVRPTIKVCKPMREVIDKTPTRKIYNMIGYCYDEPGRMAPQNQGAFMPKVFPLVEWKITRQGCIDIIKAAGLPDPGKSGCFFCPYQKTADWFNLYTKWPKLWEQCKQMEGGKRYLLPQTVKRGHKPIYLEDLEKMFKKKLSGIAIQKDLEGKGITPQDSGYACGRFNCFS